MSEFKGIFKEKQRQAKITEEYDKLLDLFSTVGPDTMEQAARLCQEAAFVRVMLLELRLIIMRDGPIEEYQNGPNQYGLKRSTASDMYDKSIGQYMKLMAHIKKLLPAQPDNAAEVGELLDFIQAGVNQSGHNI